MENQVDVMNNRIKNFTSNNKIDLISNGNVDDSCLSKRKLHLNKKGKSVLANNYIRYLNWLFNHSGTNIHSTGYDTGKADIFSEIKNLRLDYLKNVIVTYINIEINWTIYMQFCPIMLTFYALLKQS